MDMLRLLNLVFFVYLGLCFGSFALATAWRIRKERDFVREHSECEHCHHQLTAKDLVPLFSWLVLRGRCRYCHKKISRLLPIAEVSGAVVFAVSFAHWPRQFDGYINGTLFITWCVALILLLILFFYDLQWYELPNKVVHPLWGASAVYGFVVFIERPSFSTLLNIIFAVMVAGGFFWLLYEASKGKWIGFGDVRLGLAIGLFVATPVRAGLVLFVASIVGIVFALPGLLKGSRKLSSKVPFGPLLIIGLIVTMLFGQRIIDWYMSSLLLLP
jgi:prepilin signal peptidase PulO-like enzyme (type II secretory pathway)